MELMTVCYPDLEKEAFDWIQSVREPHDPNYSLIAPHFSLVFPVTEIDTNDFTHHCKDICGGVSPISFIIRRAMINKVCNTDDWYLFLVPDEGNSAIGRLHDRLYTGIFEKELMLEIPYIPHITVGRFNDGHNCKKLCDEINEKVIYIAGRISSIDIIANTKSRIKTIDKIELSGR